MDKIKERIRILEEEIKGKQQKIIQLRQLVNFEISELDKRVGGLEELRRLEEDCVG